MALVAGLHVPVFLFNVSMVDIPCLTSCGPVGWMVSAANFIL